MMKTIFALFILLNFESAWATCSALANTTLGTGSAGQVQMSTGSSTTLNKLMYCDGTNWLDFPGSPTAFICAKNGEIYYSGGMGYYCNDLFAWELNSGFATSGGCSKEGEMKWNSSISQLEVCNGAIYFPINNTDTSPDPFTLGSLTNLGVETTANNIVQITGFMGGSANVTFNTAGCSSPAVRTCASSSCSSFIASRISDGALAVPNGSFLRITFATALTGSTTCSVTVDINGVSSTLSATNMPVDTSPGSLGFTDSTNQPTSTTIVSNIARIYGHTGGISASAGTDSAGNTVSIRVCDDATCSTNPAWTTGSVTLTNPQWVQLRTVTGPALSYQYVTASIGSSTFYWNISTTTCPMTFTPTPGQTLTCVCPAGTLLSGANIGGLHGGSGNYRALSRLCRAAVHAGAVNNATGGTITVIGTTAGSPSGTCPSFVGTTANGTTSSATGSPSVSMYFQGYGTDTCN